MARTALGLSVRELAHRAGVNFTTVSKFELGQRSHSVTIAALQRELETLGAAFVADPARGEGVYIRAQPASAD